jgi:uncharacterized protein YhfF/GNAT superfamily N-acetyltransferase
MSAAEVPEHALAFWQRFERACGADMADRYYGTTYFDDNQPSADALAALVLMGKKRATAGLLWEYESEGSGVPKPGDLSIVTNWAGEPQCVIETRSVVVRPFGEVDEDFAATEGEGDGSLAYWREVHWAYFTRACARIGQTPSHDMPVACERFEVIYTEPVQGGVSVDMAPTTFDAWPDLLALLQQSFAYMAPRIDPPSSLDQLDADQLRRKADHETLILATEGDRLVGCAFAAVREDCVYVGKVAVADRGRRRGLARRLIAVAEQVARDHQRPFLELQTRIGLVENHETFSALGFVTVAQTAHPGYTRTTSITLRKPVAPAGAAPSPVARELDSRILKVNPAGVNAA